MEGPLDDGGTAVSVDGPGGRMNDGLAFGEGEMADRVRAHPWGATPLGPIASWPLSLKTAVRIMLSSRYAMWMAWGDDLTFLCNDAYLPTVGIKRDWVLGARSDKVWEEIWPDIGPRIEGVLATGKATWDEGLLLFLGRSGFPEETYHTFSYSPLADDEGRISGMLCVVTEETDRVIGERRLRTLQDLASRISQVRTEGGLWGAVGACLAAESRDLPFTLAYLFSEGGAPARLASATGMPPGGPFAPETLALDLPAPWPLAAAAAGGETLVPDLAGLLPGIPTGPWDRPPGTALVVPIAGQGDAGPIGAFVIGLNPFRPLDAAYRGFIDLCVGQIAAGLGTVNAYEAERRRAEALAEIDRAKTAFFSNVSHEFRTPLTLMLGPLEEVLARPASPSELEHQLVAVAHRNGLRLLRLVNALLDFSRIEAGRVEAHFRPVDLAGLTAELASSFRSATEKAGLSLTVETPPLSAPAFVDIDMWEKLLLNLLSNAFKFTFAGGITVSLAETPDRIRLTVADTGTGIAADQVPRLFERFHRVEGARGRSFEGSGIGLALVQELVRLHGGEIAVESELGRGTRFHVEIPRGSAHLPAAQVEEASGDALVSSRAQSFAEEAIRWLPDEQSAGSVLDLDLAAPVPGLPEGQRERILVADDNHDLRAYISRLLAERGYACESCPDGEAALEAARRQRPDLLVTDVMMPRLDGFGLLRAVRADPALRDLPVVMLSARAGDEAKVEGLDAGADDYLTKPFSARELLARISANLSLARVRRETAEAIRESEQRFRNMAEHAPVMMWVTDPEGRCTYLNRAWYEFTGQSENSALGLGWIDATHPDDRLRTERAFLEANTGRAPFRVEYRLRRGDGIYRWALDAASPRFGPDGTFHGYIGSVIDITERKDAELALQHRVDEAISARAEAEEALRQAQKMEAVGQLTGGIAHDFNNLLTVITGNIGIASRSLDAVDSTDARARRALDNAMKGAERAASLTHRLLAFSRRQPLAPKSIDVDKLLAGMSDLLNRSLGETVKLEIITTPGLWRVEVDPNQLESAVLNLAVNARDAMPGGGKLTIETENARLDADYAKNHAEVAPGQYVVVAVTDTGAGMSRETLARVFEPFFTTKEIGKGTGLGLSMVYGFTKQSGGHVKIYSELDQGTTVKIYLPRLISGEAIDEEDGVQGAEGCSNRATILVVEDDPDVRSYTCEALRELGYEVLEAEDGPAALRLLGALTQPLALLFTDVVMPGMSGGELAEKARALIPDLKVLFTSGSTRNTVMQGGRLNPGVEMIAKPFTYQALADKIQDVLDQGKTGRVLLVEDDATLRMFAHEALVGAGYSVDEAATAAETLARVRAAQGGYDGVILAASVPDRAVGALAAELRALRSHLPVLIVGCDTDELKARFAGDRCTGFVDKPYNAARLQASLEELGVRCARS